VADSLVGAVLAMNPGVRWSKFKGSYLMTDKEAAVTPFGKLSLKVLSNV
jgi:hypothetical protein